MSWSKKFARKNARAGAAKAAAIGVVMAICGRSGLAEEVGFSQPTFGDNEAPRIASDYMLSDVQPVSYTRSTSTTGGDLTYTYQGSRDWYERLSLGGYGDIHANFQKGADKDLFDLHRLVMFMGYEFNDWLTFSSELEVEHAFVADGNGEISFEQAFIEYAHNDCIHFRVGRVLAPVGIINPRHEPPSFNGVERPSFAKVIIPSTWSVDGIGITGRLGSAWKYQAYLGTSLNGDLFEEKDGIRDGRIKERGSLSQTAFTGRIDYFPFAINPSPAFQTLRFGASTFLGGLDNGNKGADPGVDAALHLISADAEFSISHFDFRGVMAYENIDGAVNLHNHAAHPEDIASAIFGFYLEGAAHIFPQSWKCGRLQQADLVAFVRYDDFDTQYRMPAGVAANDAGDRDEWTYGLTYLPIPTVALKFDYQVQDDGTAASLPDKFNFGLGFMF